MATDSSWHSPVPPGSGNAHQPGGARWLAFAATSLDRTTEAEAGASAHSGLLALGLRRLWIGLYICLRPIASLWC